MAGFGSAFSQSFNQSNQAIAEHKEDLFKLKYADFLTQRDKRQEWEQENKRNVAWAKSAARITGQPIETWGEIYNLKSSGMKDEEIMNLLRTKTAKVVSNDEAAQGGPNPVDPRQDVTAPQPQPNIDTNASPVQQQMQKSGMGGGFFNTVKDILNPNSESRSQRDALRAEKQVADAAGVTVEDIQNTLNHKYESQSDIPGLDDYKVVWSDRDDLGKPDLTKIENLNDAIAAKTWFDLHGGSDLEKKMADTYYNNFLHVEYDKNKAAGGNFFEPSRGVLKGPDGDPTEQFVFRTQDGAGNAVWKTDNGKIVQPDQVIPYDENMEKEIDKGGADLQKAADDYNTGINNLQDMVTTSTELANLAAKAPEGLDYSGSIAQGADRLIRGVKGIGTILTGQDLFAKYGGKLNAQDIGSWESDMKSNMSKLDMAEAEASDILKRTGDAAYYHVIMDIKATRLAYMYAATSGQTGKNVTEKEFNNYKLSAMGGGKPEAIRTSANTYIKSQVNLLKRQEENINKLSEPVRRFKSQYSKMPYPYKPVASLDEILQGNADLKTQIDNAMAAGSEDEIVPQSTMPDYVKKTHPEITPEMWDEMVKAGTDKLFLPNGGQ